MADQFAITLKECPQCGYQVQDPDVLRCPRCYKSLLIPQCCDGNCSSCGVDQDVLLRKCPDKKKTDVK